MKSLLSLHSSSAPKCWVNKVDVLHKWTWKIMYLKKSTPFAEFKWISPFSKLTAIQTEWSTAAVSKNGFLTVIFIYMGNKTVEFCCFFSSGCWLKISNLSLNPLLLFHRLFNGLKISLNSQHSWVCSFPHLSLRWMDTFLCSYLYVVFVC